MGIGEGVNDRKKVESAAADLALIAGQKAVITKARKSIATYKLRDGQAIGCKVTLRKTPHVRVRRPAGQHRAAARARLPRAQSPKSFDGRGNYTLGIKEHIIFPEIDYDKAADIWGMDITVCTSAKPDDEARALLDRFQLPVPAVRAKPSNAESQETLDGEEEFDREEQPAAPADQEIFRPALAAARRSRATRTGRWRSASPRRSSSRSCRAIPSATRIRNRCEMTGRPRGYYRKHKLSRIALRDLGSKGMIPGLLKSSW